ncbi:MAG: lipopolysaccharide heptosyltransferase II [Sedimentisphaerales bacterium]|nr:lipopolysaccharide heptosyltransferase II [Sedimentisphaerales bacterium]
MRKHDNEILVWLPWPMGDAILCTPALRAIRGHFKTSKITFFANRIVKEILSPNSFNDAWIVQRSNNPFVTARILKASQFDQAVLFKNSFDSALAVFLARIPSRLGYSRQGRGILLTDRMYPSRLPGGKFRPVPMVDYYLAITSRLGADVFDRSLELTVDQKQVSSLRKKLGNVAESDGPIVILVPGGAFGPSKCWPAERFAKVADWLIKNYKARIIVSVSNEPAELKIAEHICNESKNELVNLARKPLSLGELKALFSLTGLVITNDTGPRHIAIALGRKVITLFGPNDPAWTDTDYEREIQIVGNVPCAPCVKPVCRMTEHFCMNSIGVELVCKAVRELLEKDKGAITITSKQNFTESSKSFFIDPDYADELGKVGLTNTEAVFSFRAGKSLAKSNLASYRSRFRIQMSKPSTTVYLKRYDRPPVWAQLKNWFSHRKRISCAFCDFEAGLWLDAEGINVPKTICYGQQWGHLFERRSFVIAEEIANAESLERRLPAFFCDRSTAENLRLQRDFITKLASFVSKFHQTGYRHRDLYFSHIFYDDKGRFYLIDLARAFKPIMLSERYRIKDIAQLYYSARRQYFSMTDRMRFYRILTGRKVLTGFDKRFIRKVITKASAMAKHDIKHGRDVPFFRLI